MCWPTSVSTYVKYVNTFACQKYLHKIDVLHMNHSGRSYPWIPCSNSTQPFSVSLWRVLSAVSRVSIGRLAQGDAGPCWNMTCTFRPSRWAMGESALSPDASEEGAIDFDGVAGSGVAGGGGLGDGGHIYFLFFGWPGFRACGGTAGCSENYQYKWITTMLSTYKLSRRHGGLNER